MMKDERFRLEKEDAREEKELRGYVVEQITHSVVAGLRHGEPSSMSPQPARRSESDQKLPVEQPAGRQSGAQEWVNARGENGQYYQQPRDPRYHGP